MRIVVDTNVFISGLTSPAGLNRQVIRACLEGKAKPLMGSALFNEYEDLMARPETLARCPLPVDRCEMLLDAFLSCCEWIRIYFLWRPNLCDESDNHLIELAVAGGAEAIITNNLRDLHSGELAFPSLKFLTPSQFLTNLP